MNVLIFVATMLMLLAILTYGRLETYRTNQGHELLFKHYMQESERGYANSVATRKYETTTASTKNSSEPKNPKIPATPRISILYFINSKERLAHQNETAMLSTMLKKLIVNLYGEQPFYKEIEQKRPTFLNEIISKIEIAADSLPKNKKITKTTELGNLDLGDQELNDAFYKMLHGAPALEIATKPTEKPLIEPLFTPLETTEVEAENESTADKNLAVVESKEYKSPKGYFSLLDFITISNSPKVRIYLAPREVLKAIFNDDSVVDEIIKSRLEIFKSVKGDSGDVKSAGDSFKAAYESRRDPNFDESVLDFSVSKTNPKKYE